MSTSTDTSSHVHSDYSSSEIPDNVDLVLPGTTTSMVSADGIDLLTASVDIAQLPFLGCPFI